ncbi:MAG: hypothetical protein R2876_06605 [Eubacteriales bacterium]
MNKNVYSLVLMDKVVNEIDRLAYEKNTSRSNLINQILAEYVSLITPEKIREDTFLQMQDLIEEIGQFRIQQSGEGMLLLKSVIKYKYNPSIRYCVRLNRNQAPHVGRLIAAFRTQNKELLDTVSGFFKLWMSLEKRHAAKHFKEGEVFASIEEGKYQREFVTPLKKLSTQQVAEAITNYINVFDSALKAYFENGDYAIDEIERLYIDYFKNSLII